jgi:hypothetical protein
MVEGCIEQESKQKILTFHLHSGIESVDVSLISGLGFVLPISCLTAVPHIMEEMREDFVSR